MKRKDYLNEDLSAKEKLYLKEIVMSARNRYIEKNCARYKFVELNNDIVSDCKSVFDVVLTKCEKEVKSAIEFEKLISNEKLYKIIKALSLKEKMVLFYLYKENKNISQTAREMQINRETVRNIKNGLINKILRKLMGEE